MPGLTPVLLSSNAHRGLACSCALHLYSRVIIHQPAHRTTWGATYLCHAYICTLTVILLGELLSPSQLVGHACSLPAVNVPGSHCIATQTSDTSRFAVSKTYDRCEYSYRIIGTVQSRACNIYATKATAHNANQSTTNHRSSTKRDTASRERRMVSSERVAALTSHTHDTQDIQAPTLKHVRST